MRKKLIASCVALALAGGVVGTGMAVRAAETSAVIATGHPERPLQLLFSGQMGRLLTLRSELNITGDQREQIKTILQSHREELVAAIRPVVTERRALQDAVIANSSDESAIRSAATNLGTSIGDAAVVAAKVRAEVAKVLTPDQLAKVQQFRKDTRQSVDHFLDNMAKPL